MNIPQGILENSEIIVKDPISGEEEILALIDIWATSQNIDGIHLKNNDDGVTRGYIVEAQYISENLMEIPFFLKDPNDNNQIYVDAFLSQLVYSSFDFDKELNKNVFNLRFYISLKLA